MNNTDTTEAMLLKEIAALKDRVDRLEQYADNNMTTIFKIINCLRALAPTVCTKP